MTAAEPKRSLTSSSASSSAPLLRRSNANIEDDDAVQLELPFDRRSNGALDDALDKVSDRFGSAAVTRAVLLRRRRGLSVPMLPD